MVAPRNVLRTTFLFSIVVALVAAMITAYRDWYAGTRLHEAQQNVLQSLECASHLPFDALKSTSNDFGFVDLAKVGCADRSFTVSLDDLHQIRDGHVTSSVGLPKGPIVVGASLSAVTAFAAINLIGLMIVVGGWIVRSTTKGDRQSRIEDACD